MSISRRSFVEALGVGTAGALAGAIVGGRGREGGLWTGLGDSVHAAEGALILSSNENPLGPPPAILDAVRAGLGGGIAAARYPHLAAELKERIARDVGARPENIVLGCGRSRCCGSPPSSTPRRRAPS